jgi:hypothetical protein
LAKFPFDLPLDGLKRWRIEVSGSKRRVLGTEGYQFGGFGNSVGDFNHGLTPEFDFFADETPTG